MKMTTSPKPTLASLLGVSLLTLCAAGAQTQVYYTSGSSAVQPASATLGGTLQSISFDAFQTNNQGFPPSDTGAVGTQENSFGEEYWANFTIGGLPGTVGSEVLTSVTIYLWAEGAIPADTTQTINIMDGLSGSGNFVNSFVINDLFNPQFFSITVSADVLAGGFSFDSTVMDGSFNVSSEMNSTQALTPLVVATYSPIPEPSGVVLGVIGALVAFRRRRA